MSKKSYNIFRVHPQTYSFYGKTLKGSEFKRNTVDIGVKGNTSDVNIILAKK